MAAAGSKYVMVVEDDADMREAFGELLASDGHRAQLAPSGEEALAALEFEAPDLILLDMVMPEMNGEEFLQRLRANPKWADIPVVVTTAAPLRKPPAKTAALLPKPFEAGQLSEIISRYGRPAVK
jgi:CheY-like chemotaxis protein